MLGYMYNFGIVHSTMILDLCRELIDGFSEGHLEVLMVVLTHCGVSLKTDDAQGFTKVLNEVVVRRSENQSEMSIRSVYLLDSIEAMTRTTKKKKTRVAESTRMLTQERTSTMKKWLGRVKSRIPAAPAMPFRISLSDILQAESAGRWWIVGGTWSGRNTTVPDQDESHDNPLLALAVQQRMNTDIRRQVFVAIMGAQDAYHGVERLKAIQLSGRQEREIIHVLMDCALSEDHYNPYYAALAHQLSCQDSKIAYTLQIAVWTRYNQIDASNARTVYHLGCLFSDLVASGTLEWMALKVVDWSKLSPHGILFLQVALERILKTDRDASFMALHNLVLEKPKHEAIAAVKDGLMVFLHTRFGASYLKSLKDVHVRAQVEARIRQVRSLLDV